MEPADPYPSGLLTLLADPTAQVAASLPVADSPALPLGFTFLCIWLALMLLSGFESGFFGLKRTQWAALLPDYPHVNPPLLLRLRSRTMTVFASLRLAQLLLSLALTLTLGAASWTFVQRGTLAAPWVILLAFVALSLALVLAHGLGMRLLGTGRALLGLQLLAYPVGVWMWICYPIAALYALAVSKTQPPDPLLELRREKDRDDEHEPQEQENEGVTTADLLRSLANLNTIAVRSILRARVDVKAVEWRLSMAELAKRVEEYGYSRVPVYEETLDNIKGILYVKDLLPLYQQPEADWHKVVRPVLFVPESKKIHRLLDEFQQKRQHIAVVIDEYGGTAGIVTLQDILEEIFGDISDELDKSHQPYEKLDEHSWRFEGRISLHELTRVLGVSEELFDEHRGDSDTLGGLLLEQIGAIPVAGQQITLGQWHFTVLEASPRAIQWVKVSQKSEA